MLECQKDKFSLLDGLHYLNCAYKAPILKAAELKCIESIYLQRDPSCISVDDFFEPNVLCRSLFAEIINCPSAQVAIVPSVSYGFATAFKNICAKQNGNVVSVKDEFPSGYFALEKWRNENHQDSRIIEAPAHTSENWNERILNAIDTNTSAVLLASVHWMNGYIFDLDAIGLKCKENNAVFLVDGTQSVGAIPMNVLQSNIDVLICAAYKWLLGPYSTALIYLSEKFDDGEALEESWMNRINAREFTSLTDYEENYFPGAGRYNVGETSQFLQMPWAIAGMQQLLEWGIGNIRAYVTELKTYLQIQLISEIPNFRFSSDFSNHLFAPEMLTSLDKEKLMNELNDNRVSVSLRSVNLRISINVFNDKNDMDVLCNCIFNAMK